MSKCSGGSTSSQGPESQNIQQLKNLERRLLSETSKGQGLTVERAADLAGEVGNFLETHSSNESALLRTIETLLSQLSITMARIYEDTSLSKAVKASYEQRIKQLEQLLIEQTRPFSRGERTSSAPAPGDQGRQTYVWKRVNSSYLGTSND
ncbi:hypothetical protein K439DRAFT_1621572 [Ramaria rubella]|nr:hypothetical protein K439DRAFT_1621572 [Ramaria rubella]